MSTTKNKKKSRDTVTSLRADLLKMSNHAEQLEEIIEKLHNELGFDVERVKHLTEANDAIAKSDGEYYSKMTEALKANEDFSTEYKKVVQKLNTAWKVMAQLTEGASNNGAKRNG